MPKIKEVFINDLNLDRYGFKKSELYSRPNSYVKDCGMFSIGLIKCDKIYYNFVIFKEEDSNVTPIKSICNKTQLEELLNALT